MLFFIVNTGKRKILSPRIFKILLICNFYDPEFQALKLIC